MIAGVVVLLVVVFAVQRYVAQNRLADAVEAEVRAARVDLDRAQAADRKQRELSAQAFARFDAGDKAEGERLWTQVLVERKSAEDAYRVAGGRVETALAKDPTRDDVRGVLGDILLERATLAHTTRDADRRDELLARLAAYDSSGKRRAGWARPGRVVIRTRPDAQVRIERDGTPLSLGGSAPIDASLDPGSYMVLATAPGRETVRAPIFVERAGTTELDLPLPRTGTILDGFVYIPPGSFLFGTSASEDFRKNYYDAVPMHPRRAQGFLIARNEVTMGDWLAYVDAHPVAEQSKLLPAATSGVGSFGFDRHQGAWRITLELMAHKYTAVWGETVKYKNRTAHVEQDWRRFPVGGVTPAEITPYLAWLDRSKTVPGARLCSELEWEYAGRGADGREYPHGRQLGLDDANYDLTHTKPGMGFDEVGSHPATTGPFGLTDMSGNIYEWTRAIHGDGFVVRSGAFYADRKSANLANRTEAPPTMKLVELGMRVCAPLPADALR